MIILKRNVTVEGTPHYAGADVDGVLDKEILDDLLKTGWAEQKDAEPKQDDQDDQDDQEIDLSSMNVNQLKEMAKEMAIDGFAQMNKAALIEAIIAADAEQGGDE